MDHQDPKTSSCPSCSAAMTPGSVVCVACGYHLTQGHHLGTAVVRDSVASPDSNPYASPHANPSSGTAVFDLTEVGARRARAVVSDAQKMPLFALLGWCLCGAVWIVVIAWYGFRLLCWHQLNREFAELRHPNSFSQHGDLPIKFQDSKNQLWIGIFAGLAYCAIVAFVHRRLGRGR